MINILVKGRCEEWKDMKQGFSESLDVVVLMAEVIVCSILCKTAVCTLRSTGGRELK